MNATVPIVPKVVAPGYNNAVPELEGGNGNIPVLPLEEVIIQDGNSPSVQLSFDDPTDISSIVRDVSTAVKRTKWTIR